MDIIVVLFRDVLDGPLYIVVTVICSIFICSCLGYLAEKKANEKKEKEKYATGNKTIDTSKLPKQEVSTKAQTASVSSPAVAMPIKETVVEQKPVEKIAESVVINDTVKPLTNTKVQPKDKAVDLETKVIKPTNIPEMHKETKSIPVIGETSIKPEVKEIKQETISEVVEQPIFEKPKLPDISNSEAQNITKPTADIPKKAVIAKSVEVSDKNIETITIENKDPGIKAPLAPTPNGPIANVKIAKSEEQQTSQDNVNNPIPTIM